MKKLILILICLFMSFKSFSESNWTTFFENKDGGLYHNWDSLRIVDNSVFLLEKNLRKKPPKGEVSCRIRYIETNCKTLMSRTLNSKYYFDSECINLISEKKKPEDWEYYDPDHFRFNFHNQLCDLKNLKK